MTVFGRLGDRTFQTIAFVDKNSFALADGTSSARSHCLAETPIRAEFFLASKGRTSKNCDRLTKNNDRPAGSLFSCKSLKIDWISSSVDRLSKPATGHRGLMDYSVNENHLALAF
jgi:hypothetical protein